MNVRQITGLSLAAWFAAILTLGSAGAFVTPPGVPPLPILLGFVLPLAVFLAAYYGSSDFRAQVLSADPRVFAAVQAWRFGGFSFLELYAYGVLPGLFAWPAAIGDITVALAAPWIVVQLSRDPAFARSRRFVAWNLFGILDLVLAVSLGALSSGLVPGLTPVTTEPMARMPLVLIPAFFVPLFIMLHFAALFQARRFGLKVEHHGRNEAVMST